MWPLRQKVLLTQRRPFVVLFNKLPCFSAVRVSCSRSWECMRWKHRGWEITNHPPPTPPPREPKDPGAPDSGVITCCSLTFSTQEQQNQASRRGFPSPKPLLLFCCSWLEHYWAWIKSNGHSGDMKTRTKDMSPKLFDHIQFTTRFQQLTLSFRKTFTQWAYFLQNPAAKPINRANKCNYILNRSG